jgi:hypothetical protein
MEFGVMALLGAALAGYLLGRDRARAQVFRQVWEMRFLSDGQREQVRTFLIHRSGK